MKLKFDGKVENKKLVLNDSKAFLNHVAGLDAQEVQITLEKRKKYVQRSNNQNRYYWGVVISILSAETGYSSTEMHEVLKYEFLGRMIKLSEKIQSVTFSSTADLTTSEFEDYLSRVRTWASIKLSIYIPEPNEVPYEY